jgi:hypothetical protein
LGKKPRSYNYQKNFRERMKIINRELVLPEDYEPPLESGSTNRRKKPNQAKPITMNLVEISIIELYHDIRDKKNEFFIISLYKIDQIFDYR